MSRFTRKSAPRLPKIEGWGVQPIRAMPIFRQFFFLKGFPYPKVYRNMFRVKPRATLSLIIFTVLIQKSEKQWKILSGCLKNLPSGIPLGHQTFPRCCAPRESLMTLGNALGQIFPDNHCGLSTVYTTLHCTLHWCVNCRALPCVKEAKAEFNQLFCACIISSDMYVGLVQTSEQCCALCSVVHSTAVKCSAVQCSAVILPIEEYNRTP